MIRRAFIRMFSGARDWLLRRKPEPYRPEFTEWTVREGGPVWDGPVGADLSNFKWPADLNADTPYEARIVEHFPDGSKLRHPTFRFRYDSDGNVVPALKVEP